MSGPILLGFSFDSPRGPVIGLRRVPEAAARSHDPAGRTASATPETHPPEPLSKPSLRAAPDGSFPLRGRARKAARTHVPGAGGVEDPE